MYRKIPYLIQIVVFLSAVCFLLFACGPTKYIDRETVRVDSSMYEQNEGLQHALLETITNYENEREEWTRTGILFDTVYKDTGRVVNRVTFDNGKIKTIEGRIIAINTDLHEKTAELLDAHSTIDDLSVKLETAETKLAKKQDVLIKEVRKSFLPWWVWLLVLVGFAVRHFWPRIKVLLPFKF